MRLRRLPSLLCAAVALLAAAPAQDWTDDQLVAACADFQQEGLAPRYAQIAALLAAQPQAAAAIAARLHGDHREYQLKVDRLLGALADARWQAREDAERQLIEIGSRAWAEIQATKERSKVIDQQIRCARILDALAAKGTESEDRERRLLRGLRAVGRGVPRAEMTVLRGTTPVGVTTSGTFSPTLGAGIALALIDTDADVTDGDTVSVDVRGRGLEFEVIKPPFVQVKTR